jgi:hypothetical protein
MHKILIFWLFFFSGSVFADTYSASVSFTYSTSIGYSYATLDIACSTYGIPCGSHYATGRSPNEACLVGSVCTIKSFYDGVQDGSYLAKITTNRSFSCPGGGTVSGTNCINAPACVVPQVRNATTGICGLPPKSNGSNNGNDCTKSININVGNPINVGTGNKWQHETDLSGGAFGLTFDRNYNASTTANSSNIGAGWVHTYTRLITVQSTGTWVTIRRQDGKEYNFQQSAGAWVPDADVPDRLEELKDSASVRTGWRYTTADNSVETYNVTGQLTSIADRTGYTQTLTYSDATTPVAIAPTANLLIRVTDTFSRQLNFT